MLRKDRIYSLFFIIFSMVFLFSSVAVSEEGWLKSLKNSTQADRIKLNKRDVQQNEQLSQYAVFMQHSSFFLDRTYIPHIEKTGGHILIQLSQPLNTAIEEKLKEHGVELLEYIPSNTWKARIPVAEVLEVHALDFVNAMGEIYPVDKFPKHVMEKDFNPFTYNNDRMLSLLVTFHKDIPFNRALEILAELSGTTHQMDFITGHRILGRIPKERLRDLAEYDEVNWIEDRPTPKKTGNIDAAAVSNINDVQAAPYNLDGSGVGIGEWDGGEVQSDHPDLVGRVTVIDTGSVSDHATHVAGTMIGSGAGDINAKGMAPAASLYSYDFWDDVLSEMSSAVVTYGIELSNNSWCYATGWEWNYYNDDLWVWFGDSNFGAYTSVSQAWDQTIIDTDLIIVKSAGNDRNDDGDQAQTGHHHAGDPFTVYTDYHPPDGDFDCIGQIGASKNIITVGAANDFGYMGIFSSWGPVDDGRVKPDIMANGVELWSTCLTDSYCEKSGTSQSTPVVTGAIALIIERYRDVFGTDPSPTMVKALLIGTAGELGNIGPDYSHGWGMMDVRAAVDLIDGGDTYLKNSSVSNGETVDYPLSVSSTDKVLKVTTVWTDPAGTPGVAKALVNDIDLKLIDPLGLAHWPWKLNPSSPISPATRGVNSLDNVEQVLVNFPKEGTWTIRITGTSIQGSQAFAVVSSLVEEFPVNTYTFSVQSGSAVADLSGGGFVVIWQDAFQDDDGYGVYGQRFDSGGNPVGDEFHVNTYTDDDQGSPSVTELSGGGFVVTWDSEDQGGSDGVYGQRFNSSGEKVGGEFQVNTTTGYNLGSPSVAPLSSGGFVVAWQTNSKIYCQRFDSAGNKVETEFKASTYNVCNSPSAAGLSGGCFVVTWQSWAQDGSRNGIYGQLFNGSGDPVGGEFLINTHTADNQWHPSVAALSGGGFVVTWSSENQDGDGYGVYGQAFNSAGSKVGSEFPVNTHTADDQDYPAVAGLSGGGFVVTWESYGQDGNSEGIYGQIFDSAESTVGDEFQVNTYIVNRQESPSVAGLLNGDFVVTWTSDGQDGNSLGVFGKRFIVAEPCECDLNHDGRCDMQDWLKFGEDWGRTDCGTPTGSGNEPNDCECDLNADGKCDMQDWLMFGEDWGRTDCP